SAAGWHADLAALRRPRAAALRGGELSTHLSSDDAALRVAAAFVRRRRGGDAAGRTASLAGRDSVGYVGAVVAGTRQHCGPTYATLGRGRRKRGGAVLRGAADRARMGHADAGGRAGAVLGAVGLGARAALRGAAQSAVGRATAGAEPVRQAVAD